MSTEQKKERDYFWFYIAVPLVALVMGILYLKKSDSEQYAPMKQLMKDEKESMNIQVLKDYE